MRAAFQLTRTASIAEEFARELATRVEQKGGRHTVMAAYKIRTAIQDPLAASLDEGEAAVMWDALRAWIDELDDAGIPADLVELERLLRDPQ